MKACRRALLRAFGPLTWTLVLTPSVFADHISGASITYECLSGNQYRVYLDLFLDCAGAPVTTQTLRFKSNCGVSFDLINMAHASFTEVSPLCPSQLGNSTCNGGTQPGFRKYRYQVTLTLTPCNSWTIEWYTCCRNTLQNVNQTPGTYAVATLNNAGGLCDRSPVFADSGVPYVCVNQPVSYNPGVSDADGNTMSFALINARYAAPLPTSVTYINGYTGALPIAGMIFDPATGQMYFTPTTTGYYAVVYQVTTYNALGQLIGRVMRDLMFVVVNCDGTAPTSTGISNSTNGTSFGPVSFVACGTGPLCIDIPFTDAQVAQTVTVTSNVTSLLPGATFSVSGTNPAIATICWTPNQAVLPISIWLHASDNSCPIANDMSTYVTAVSCAYLPVELLRFEAVANDLAVRLDWATGSEEGSARFIVERSANGTRYDPIGTLPAAGYAFSETRYGFDDDQPFPGTSYYRLQQVDFDGSTTFSPVVSVNLDAKADGLLAERTVDGWLLHGASAGWTWDLFDARGARIGTGSTADWTPIQVNHTAAAMAALIVRSPHRSYRLLLPPTPAGIAGPVLVRSK